MAVRGNNWLRPPGARRVKDYRGYLNIYAAVVILWNQLLNCYIFVQHFTFYISLMWCLFAVTKTSLYFCVMLHELLFVVGYFLLSTGSDLAVIVGVSLTVVVAVFLTISVSVIILIFCIKSKTRMVSQVSFPLAKRWDFCFYMYTKDRIACLSFKSPSI